jgi:restriction system protein
MGAIWFTGSALRGTVGDITGTKSGLALSFEEIMDHSDQRYHATLQTNNDDPLRIRSEEFEELILGILYRLGHSPSPVATPPISGLYHKHKNDADFDKDKFNAILELATEAYSHAVEATLDSGSKFLDPTPIVMRCRDQYGLEGALLAIEFVKAIQLALEQSVFGQLFTHYGDIDRIQLIDLFRSESLDAQVGEFIDQRYIDYLSQNFDAIDRMNWRKFEGLSAEYFHREGYHVEIGPGRNDDGIDLRVWRDKGEKGLPPLLLVQCKRQKSAVEKVVVKAMYADIDEHKAGGGLIVTTNRLSEGARNTINARCYPISEADRKTLGTWIRTMRTPWSGIFMSE